MAMHAKGNRNKMDKSSSIRLEEDPLFCAESLEKTCQVGVEIGMLHIPESDAVLSQSSVEILNNNKLYFCPTCNKSLRCKRSLENHKKRHKGILPYKCEDCGKRFTEKSTLLNHRRIHSNQRPFTCTQPGCSKKFKCASNLADHLKSCQNNKVFVCAVCSKGFNRAFLLNRHMLTHSDHKPYSCNVCLKKFNQKSNLDVHMKVHTGQKDFVCRYDNCNRRFRTKAHLKYHESSNHHVYTILAD